MRVSIITPTYNRGRLIENTIKSVIGQTYNNIEYIIVDGGSEDNTLDILEKYRKIGSLSYISRKDEGMYFAINEGIKMSSGDVVSYLNSDDLYFPWSVKRAIDEFKHNSDIDMIYGDSMVLDLTGDRTYLNIYPSHRKYWLSSGGVLCQPTVFMRRRVFDMVGFFDTSYNYLADCEYWNRINNHSELKIVKIDELMAIECNHEGTIREKMKAVVMKEQELIFEIYKRSCPFGLPVRILKMLSYLRRELKIVQFIFFNYISSKVKIMRWNNYLLNYAVSFKFINYILSKVLRGQPRVQRFAITQKHFDENS